MDIYVESAVTRTLLAASVGIAVSVGLSMATAGHAAATTYCPGQNLAKDPWPGFDRSVCHNYHYATTDNGHQPGWIDDDTGIFHPWAPVPPAAPPAPNWCPGDPIPGGFAPEDVNWDATVCHHVKYIPDPGSLVIDEPNNYHVVAGDPRPGCPRAAQVAPLPCL